MFTIHPKYYEEFHCTASACSDNCCIGWEIDIDEESLRRYMSVPGALGGRLKEHIDTTGSDPHFILTPNERCPFLNNDNLCDIILELGEESICQICTDHPRFYECYEQGIEEGVGLCCEEAARLILSGDPALICLGKKELTEEEAYYMDLREELMSGLCQGSWSIYNIFEELPDLKELISFMKALEINSPHWLSLLGALEQDADLIVASIDTFESETSADYFSLLRYFIYRYFMKSRFDGDTDSYVNFCLLSVYMLEIMDIHSWLKNKELTLHSRVSNCKFYSQEIEYCTENVEALMDLYI